VSLIFLQRGSMDCKGLFWLPVLLMAEAGFGLKKLAAHESFTLQACPFLLQVSSPVNTAGLPDEWDEPFGSTGSPVRNSTQPDTA